MGMLIRYHPAPCTVACFRRQPRAAPRRPGYSPGTRERDHASSETEFDPQVFFFSTRSFVMSYSEGVGPLFRTRSVASVRSSLLVIMRVYSQTRSVGSY